MSSHCEDAIHWWHQFCIDHPCLLQDLQRLCNNTQSKHAEGSTPLAAFKAYFSILFECLHAVFGLICPTVVGVSQSMG
jgi:hypothetical protein